MLVAPLQPLRPSRTKRPARRFKNLPAPTDGWIDNKSLSDFGPREAIDLHNVVVVEKGIATRPGYVEHATGLGDTVKALLPYEGLTTKKLFGATDSAIYEVTSSGAVGAAAVSSLTSGNWTSTMFATTGGNFLVASNGADSVRNYDGSSWTTPNITNVTSSDLWRHIEHQNRLWFIEKDTLSVWYLPAGNLAGAATELDLGPFSSYGGALHSIATWTRDGGSGLDDVFIAITDQGETHIYSGSDPSSSSTWSRVGTFKLPKPIGCNCTIKVGSDVAIITEQGVIPLSAVLSIAATRVEKEAATERVGNAFQTAAANAGSISGWRIIEWPEKALAIVNIPFTSEVRSEQYVYSTTGGAWSRWTDLNAQSWAHLDGEMYFGKSDGTVQRLSGNTDAGAAIPATIVHRFDDFGTRADKFLRRVRPLSFGPAGYTPRVGVRADYDDNEDVFAAQTFSAIGATWDEAEWDVAEWAYSLNANRQWVSARGHGHHLAIVIQISTTEEVIYNGCDVIYEAGDVV